MRALRYESPAFDEHLMRRLEVSTLSGKLDFTSTASTKAPIILKFGSGDSGRQKRPKAERKSKRLSVSIRRRSKSDLSISSRPTNDPSEAISIISGGYDNVPPREWNGIGPGHNQLSPARDRPFSAIPEESSQTETVDEHPVGLEELDEDIDDVERNRGGYSNSAAFTPSLLRVRNRFRAARKTRNRNESSGRGLRIMRHREESRNGSDDLDGIMKTDEFSTVDEERRNDFSNRHLSILRNQQQDSTPSTIAPASPQFSVAVNHAATPTVERDASTKRHSILPGRIPFVRRLVGSSDRHVALSASRPRISLEVGAGTLRQTTHVSNGSFVL